MIKNNNEICGFSQKLKGRFEDLVKVSSAKTEADFAVSAYTKSERVTLMQPLMKAVMLYIEHSYREGSDNPHAALGKTSSGEWIAEIGVRDNEHITNIAVYNPNTGEIRAGSYNDTNHKMINVAIRNNGNATPIDEDVAFTTDGTIVWYVAMPEILSDPEVLDAVVNIKSILDIGKPMKETQKYWNIICSNVYCRAVSATAPADKLLNIQNVGFTGPIFKISDAKLRNGMYSVSEKIKGRFNLVEQGNAAAAVVTTKLDKSTSSLGWEFNAMVQPFMVKDMSHYVPKKNVADIIKILKAGEKRPELKIRNFFLVGPPGSGKSEDAKALAYYADVPFMVMCLSSGVTEENLKGFIAPGISGAGLTDEEKEAVEAVTSLFPTAEFLELEPEAAYQKITGKKCSGISMEEVYSIAYSKLLAEAKKRELNNPKSNQEEGLFYRYLPSPLVLAAKFGGVVEIQEPSSVADPTVLTCLNEFMNKPDGVLDTPVGQIKRNPHCVIVMTDNYSTDIGNNNMNQAVKDRAGTVTFWYERASKGTMVSMVKKQGITIDDKTLNIMAETIEVIDNEAQKMDNSIKAVAGYRSYLAWAQTVEMGFPVVEAMERCVINKMASNPEERELLIDIVENNTMVHEL